MQPDGPMFDDDEDQAYEDQAYEDQAYEDQAYEDQAYEDQAYEEGAYQGADEDRGAQLKRFGLVLVGAILVLGVTSLIVVALFVRSFDIDGPSPEDREVWNLISNDNVIQLGERAQDMDQQQLDGFLGQAIRTGSPRSAQVLLDQGGNLSAETVGDALTKVANGLGDVAMVDWLVGQGTNPCIRPASGELRSDIAKDAGNDQASTRFLQLEAACA